MADPVDIVYFHDSPVLGGAENSLLNLTTHLDREKFRPHFIIHGEGGFAERIRAAGMDVEFCDFPPIKRPNPFRMVRAVRCMARAARRYQARIVHGNTPRSNFYAACVGKLIGARVVWHARNLLKPGMRDLDNWLAFLPDRILCNSDAIRERFRGKPKAITIINGVDFSKFDRSISGEPARRELGIPLDAIVVGVTSRLEREKGHDCFLKAAGIVAKQEPRAWFLIVGKAFVDAERREAELRQLAQDEGVAERTVFAGFRTDMPQMLAAMDIFVLAAEAEPCGRVLFEAEAMALPIIGTNTGGTPEIVDDGRTGILFDPGDHETLARHILELCRDPDRRAALGQAGFERAKSLFSIEAHVRKTERVYEELLGLAPSVEQDGE